MSCKISFNKFNTFPSNLIYTSSQMNIPHFHFHILISKKSYQMINYIYKQTFIFPVRATSQHINRYIHSYQYPKN